MSVKSGNKMLQVVINGDLYHLLELISDKSGVPKSKLVERSLIAYFQACGTRATESIKANKERRN